MKIVIRIEIDDNDEDDETWTVLNIAFELFFKKPVEIGQLHGVLDRKRVMTVDASQMYVLYIVVD